MKLPPASTAVIHEIAPVWNEASEILILGTMPSPKSREAGFFYMHPQNRFWRVLSAIFGERFEYANNGTRASELPQDRNGGLGSTPPPTRTLPNKARAIAERRDFLLRRHIALWDVLLSCNIHGAADSSIKNAIPNDFHEIFENARIRRVFCTGKTAFGLWQKFCASEYEERFGVATECLPSTSPANASWSLERLIGEYERIKSALG